MAVQNGSVPRLDTGREENPLVPRPRSVVIHHLKHIKSANDAVIYAYLDHNDSNGTETSTLIASFVRQLAEQTPDLSGPLLDAYERHTKQDTPLLGRECKKLFLSEASRFKRVYIIIDGLDERRDEAAFGLLSAVNQLLISHAAASLLVSSRKIDSIQSFLDDPVIFDLAARRADIDMYIDGSLSSRLPVLSQRVRRYTGLSDFIKDRLNEKAQGMFLLPKLHLQILENSKCRNRKAYEQLLYDLPSPLGQTYELLWSRIQGQDNNDAALATTIVTWLSCGREPLSIQAFGYALLASSTGEQRQICEDDLVDEEQPVDVCLGLVAFNREKDIVTFSHYTAEEHFREILPIAKSHQCIAVACIRYISVIPLEASNHSVALDFTKQLSSFPLFPYAARNWGFHAKTAGEVSILPDILQFFDLPERTSISGRVLALSHDQSYLYDPNAFLPDEISGIHLAAFFGLLSVVKEIAHPDWCVDLRDTRGWSVLRWACFGQQTDCVRLLLGKGAAADCRDAFGDTTLIWALGSRKTIRVFKGICLRDSLKHFGHTVYVNGMHSVNPTLPEEPTPLNCTSEIIEDLIQYSQDLDARGSQGRTALSYAAENQQFGVVEWLLDRGVNIDCEDDNGMTPLLWSLQAPRWSYKFIDCSFYKSTVLIGDFIVVDLLDTSSRDGTLSRTLPPRDLAQENHALQLIGRNINAVDISGLSALTLAAERGHSNLVKRLIELEADVNMISDGFTTLDRASMEFRRFDLGMSNCIITHDSVLLSGPYMQIHWDPVRGLKHVELSQFSKSRSLICDMLRNVGAQTAVPGDTHMHYLKDSKFNYMRLNGLDDIQLFADFVWPRLENTCYEDISTSQRSMVLLGDRRDVISGPVDFRASPSFKIFREDIDSGNINPLYVWECGYKVA